MFLLRKTRIYHDSILPEFPVKPHAHSTAIYSAGKGEKPIDQLLQEGYISLVSAHSCCTHLACFNILQNVSHSTSQEFYWSDIWCVCVIKGKWWQGQPYVQLMFWVPYISLSLSFWARSEWFLTRLKNTKVGKYQTAQRWMNQ